MNLIAYALGRNIVAAASAEDAVLVMDRCESPGRWGLGDVRELTAVELAEPVDDSSDETVEQVLARFQALEPRSRLSAVQLGSGQLIRWDYPAS